MKIHYLLLLIPILFFSCKKERTFHITAKNAVTGEPYPGLSYNIERSWSGSFENKYKTVGSGYLDANGEVYFTKRLHENSSYSISVGSPENTCYFNSGSLSPGGEKNFKAEFEFAGCANLKLQIHNVNCQGPADSMRFRSKYNYENQWQGWTTYRTGCYDFDSPDYFEVSQGTRMYEWEVIRNGNKTTYSGSVLLNKGGYGMFEMNY